MMTNISRRNMGKETAIATQEMEEGTVMIAMMVEEAVIKEMITVIEGIGRAAKEVSLKDRVNIELVVMTIINVIRGMTESLAADVVNEGHQEEEVSNMKGWSSKAHLLAFLLPLLHPKKKQLSSRPGQSAWKTRGWRE